MYIVRLFFCLFVLTTSSCGELIPVSVGPEKPTKAERDEISQLIGQSREVVVKNLGPPNRQFILDDREFMLYVSWVANYKVDIPWVIIPWPIPHNYRISGTALRCLVIEIDSNNLVKEDKFKNATPYQATPYKDQSTRCLNQFFSESKLKYVTFVRFHVAIDIKPDSNSNAVNPEGAEVITVAILGSMNFDPIGVAPSTVTFGPSQASPTPDYSYEDVNDDGIMDRVFHFKTQEAGIICGFTEAILNGETYFGRILFTGTDTVNTVGCN